MRSPHEARAEQEENNIAMSMEENNMKGNLGEMHEKPSQLPGGP